MELRIKNMVCARCIRVVREELEALGITVEAVGLGVAHLGKLPDGVSGEAIRTRLQRSGFELIETERESLVEWMKVLLINEFQHLKGERLPTENVSAFLERKLGYDYSYLSGLFSSSEKQTIEKYVIALKIEKVKEWLQYDQQTLSQMADKLGYSSVHHLSNQFRQVVGQTPTHYRAAARQARIGIDGL